MTDKSYAAALEEIETTATAMIAGSISLVHGSRILCSLRHDARLSDDETFFPVIAFESETDHHPIGSARERCSKALLRELDRDLKVHESEARTAVLTACENIVKLARALQSNESK